MKKENRYSMALGQIKPSDDFESETLKKLRESRTKSAPWWKNYAGKYAPALAAVACLLIAAIALPQLIPGLFGAKNGAPDADQPQATLHAQVQATGAPLATAYPAILATYAPLAGKADANRTAYYDAEYEETAEEAYEMADGFLTFDTAFSANSAIMFNTEEYSYISESGFKNVATSPLSTFAADVDTASYTTTRRKLLNGELPDGSAVRIEEMLNYFSYTDLAPQDGSDVKLSACLAPCPWNEKAALMFVALGAKRIATEELPRSNIVFLIDTSGSMEGADRLGLIQRAFALLTQNLREGDVISIVTYAGSDRVELEGVDGAKRSEIMDAINRLEAWGSTNGSAGINTAYQLAEKYYIEGGNNRVILMTDGDLNVGVTSQAALTELIEEKKQSGVFLSVFGFGWGNTKDSKMESLADHGNGNYCYIDSITEARRSLVEQMGAGFFTVAKDVKLQVEFNPEYVSSYRLIGYENRLMAAEDFSDDTKDGGEMGSGHTVVALYELIPAEGQTLAGVTGSQGGAEAAPLKYQTSQTNSIPEAATVQLRYKQPEAEESSLYSLSVAPDALAEGEMQRNLSLASAVTQFGMLLRNSEYKGSASWDMALKTLQGLDGLSDDETELMYLITRAKALKQ